MQHNNRCVKARLESSQHLGCKANFRQQNQYLSALIDDFGSALQVNFGFPAAGNPLNKVANESSLISVNGVNNRTLFLSGFERVVA